MIYFVHHPCAIFELHRVRSLLLSNFKLISYRKMFNYWKIPLKDYMNYA